MLTLVAFFITILHVAALLLRGGLQPHGLLTVSVVCRIARKKLGNVSTLRAVWYRLFNYSRVFFE